MKKLFLALAIFAVLKVNAQNYLIAFTGSGASNTLSTVKVENLTTGETLTINGTDVLNLKGSHGVTGIDDKNIKSGIKIYPNPMIDNATIEVYPPVLGNATISIFDISGKQVAQIHSYLENSMQEFRLSGDGKGLYIVIVRGSTYQLSGKLICNGNPNGIMNIEKISSNNLAIDEEISKMNYKGVMSAINMPYSEGDRLKFTGISDNYSTVITGIIEQDKKITFNFIPCTDGDNNNYPVVKIGTQTWITENLKTTKYNNDSTLHFYEYYGNTFPEYIHNIGYRGSTPGYSPSGYSWHMGDEATNKNTYGALYNWYAVNTGKLCPTGWHVPSNEEWIILTNYLGGGGVAGGKLKETGKSHWNSPNPGNNETGFTALPGGLAQGEYLLINYDGYWWTSTEYSSQEPGAYYRHMSYYGDDIDIGAGNKEPGLSVRCVKD